jgi:quercetin dioxygenase-like cupin family protein
MESLQSTATAAAHKFDLAAQVKALESQKPWAQGMSSHLLLKADDFRVLLVAMEAGAKMNEHHSDGRLSIHVLQGAIRIGIQGETERLAAGQLLIIDKSVRHDVEAAEQSVFLLTISWPSAEELKQLPHRGYGF